MVPSWLRKKSAEKKVKPTDVVEETARGKNCHPDGDAGTRHEEDLKDAARGQ